MITVSEILPVRLYIKNESNFASLESRPTGRGYNASKWLPFSQRWEIGFPIIWRFEYDGTITPAVNGGNDPFTINDITPTGWLGKRVQEVRYTPTTAGQIDFEFTFDDGAFVDVLTSECLIVQETLRGFMLIEYNNTLNTFGTLFNSDPFIVFARGEMQSVPMDGDIDTFNETTGNSVILKQTIRKKYELNINGVPQWFAIMLSMALTTDRLIVNNTPVRASDVPKIKSVNGTNFQEIKTVLQRAEWDFANDWSAIVGDFAITTGEQFATTTGGQFATTK